MSRLDDLKRAGVGAAREARASIAELAARIEGDPEFGQGIAGIVGTLFAAEIGDAEAVLDAIERAMAQARALLAGHGVDPAAQKTLSRALALLHPVRAELARALGRTRDEPTAPFLLTPARIKPMPARRTDDDGEPEIAIEEEDDGPEIKIEEDEDDGEPAIEIEHEDDGLPQIEIEDGDDGAPAFEFDEERREHEREELEMEVGLEGDNTFFTGRSGDLSKGGLFVATDDPLPVGTELLLSFVLPDGHRVRAQAVIAWVRAPRYRDGELPAGMGVRFLSLSQRDARAIEHYLERHPAFRYGD